MKRPAHPTMSLLALSAGATALALSAGAGCVSNQGLMVILQNQQPVVNTDTTMGQICSAGTTPSAVAVGAGVLDLEVGNDPFPSYLAYPLVQSRLPTAATVPGGADPNTVQLQGVRGTLYPPPGLTIDWPAGCPDTFYSASSGALLPGASQAMIAQVISPCQAEVLHDLFASGQLPPDLSQQVIFTVEMRAVGAVGSGSQVESDAFRLSVRVCIGCLQTGFSDLAQFNWPARPACSAAPKPNPHHGNPCNVAQDFGPLLCCTGDKNQAVCPAPDM
jgi:hypothetical protein